MAQACPVQGVTFQGLLKQDVSRRGHMDVFMPCPGRWPLGPGRRS